MKLLFLSFFLSIHIVLSSQQPRRPKNVTDAHYKNKCINEHSGSYYVTSLGHICCMCYPGYHWTEDCRINYPNTTQCMKCVHDGVNQTYTSEANVYPSCKTSKTELDCKRLMYTKIQIGNSTVDNKCICIDGTFAITPGVSGCKEYTKCAPGYGVERSGNRTHDVLCRLCEEGTCSYRYSDTEICMPTTDPCNVTSAPGSTTMQPPMPPKEEQSSSSYVLVHVAVLVVLIIWTAISVPIAIFFLYKHFRSKPAKDSVPTGPCNGGYNSLPHSPGSGGGGVPDGIQPTMGNQNGTSNGQPQIGVETGRSEQGSSTHSLGAAEDDPFLPQNEFQETNTISERPGAPAASENIEMRDLGGSAIPTGPGVSDEGMQGKVQEDVPEVRNECVPIPEEQVSGPATPGLPRSGTQHPNDDIPDDQEDLSIFDSYQNEITELNIAADVLKEKLACEKCLKKMHDDLGSKITTTILKEFIRNCKLLGELVEVTISDIEKEKDTEIDKRTELLLATRTLHGNKLNPKSMIMIANSYRIRKIFDILCISFIDQLKAGGNRATLQDE